MPASPYDLCSQERDRLLDKVAALEAELAEVKRRCGVAEFNAAANEDRLVEALRERDEARADAYRLRAAVRLVRQWDMLTDVWKSSDGPFIAHVLDDTLRDTTSKTEEGGK